MKLCCEKCGKRLSRKTARLIEGKVLCSTCMFGPSPLERAKASYRPLLDVDELVGITERVPAQAIEARRAATAKTGAVEDESAVREANAPNPDNSEIPHAP